MNHIQGLISSGGLQSQYLPSEKSGKTSEMFIFPMKFTLQILRLLSDSNKYVIQCIIIWDLKEENCGQFQEPVRLTVFLLRFKPGTS